MLISKQLINFIIYIYTNNIIIKTECWQKYIDKHSLFIDMGSYGTAQGTCKGILQSTPSANKNWHKFCLAKCWLWEYISLKWSWWIIFNSFAVYKAMLVSVFTYMCVKLLITKCRLIKIFCVNNFVNVVGDLCSRRYLENCI